MDRNTKVSLAFSYFPTSTRFEMNHTIHGSWENSKVELEGSGLAIEPGLRVYYGGSSTTIPKGFLFIETPVKMFSGSGSKYIEPSTWSRNLRGKVFEMGLGVRVGMSLSVYRSLSVMVGMHVEKLFLSYEMQENYVALYAYSTRESDFSSGMTNYPVVGVSLAPGSGMEVAMVLNFPNYSSFSQALNITAEIDGNMTTSTTGLEASDGVWLEIRAGFLW